MKTNSMRYALRAAILASFAQDAGEVAAALGGFGVGSWQRELEWLDVNGLALYLLDHLQRLGQERLLPPAILARLRQNLADNRVRTAALLSEAVEINQSFAGAGIACLYLKGVTLSPESVPDPSLRLQLDLDLMVLEDAADKARAVLEAQGYALECKVGRTWQFRAGSSELPSLKDIYKVKPQRAVDLHLSAANGLLARAVRREFFGVELPALGPVDVFLMQAEHLFKHLCCSSTRAAWALEARRHILTRAGDRAFWQSVGMRVEGEPRVALAVAVVGLLVEELFGDALPAFLAGLIEAHVSRGVRLWVERYGLRVQMSGVFGTKHYLLLLAELPKIATRDQRSVRSWLVPRVLPAMITTGFAGETAGSRLRRYRIQVGFLRDRLLFHGVEGLRYVVESYRFRRLLIGVRN